MTQDDGFLSRWSRRKTVARSHEAPSADETPAQQPEAMPAATPTPPPLPVPATAAIQAKSIPEEGPPAAEPAPLTLADVAGLGRDSDYSAFVGRDVAPDVRNAALKKLFTDPHYNVMDGLDTYIDDYGVADPLPPGMLQKMTQTAFLGLFHQEDEPALAEPLAQSESASVPDTALMAAAELHERPLVVFEPTPDPVPEPASDEDPDLRLQPDDAVGRVEPGAGSDENPRRQR